MQDVINIANKNATIKKTIGERSIYSDLIVKLGQSIKTGELMTYAMMDKEIGMDTSAHGDGYGYQYSARQILMKDYNIVFENVPKEGYRRLSHADVGSSSVLLINKDLKSSIKRNMRRINTVIDEFDSLPEAVRNKITVARTILAMQESMSKRKNIQKIENKVCELKKTLGFKTTLSLFIDEKSAKEDSEKSQL